MAAFQESIYGRFWVFTEGFHAGDVALEREGGGSVTVQEEARAQPSVERARRHQLERRPHERRHRGVVTLVVGEDLRRVRARRVAQAAGRPIPCLETPAELDAAAARASLVAVPFLYRPEAARLLAGVAPPVPRPPRH